MIENPEVLALVKSVSGSATRRVLSSVLSYLILENYITQDDANKVVTYIAASLVFLLYSIHKRVRENRRVQVSLALPADTSRAELERLMKQYKFW